MKFFQVNLGSSIVLAVILGVVASISIIPPKINKPGNSLGKPKLIQPIIIPNLTGLSEALFTTTPRINETQKIKVGPQDYFVKKIFYPNEAVSQESQVDEKFTKEEKKANDNALRFSSRYSSASHIPDDSEEQADSSEEEDEEDKEESVTRTTTDENSSENSRIIKDDVISERDYSEPPQPTHSYFESSEDENSEIRHFNEPKDTEEENLTTTSEPYTELRSSTSFRNSQNPDEEFEYYETSSESIEEKKNSHEDEEEEKENKVSPDDYQESTSKNYHSVQTPLSQIRFRGPHTLKAEFEESRTRIIPPINRLHITHNWPYSRPALQNEEDNSNEVLDSDENEDSDEWKSTTSKTSATTKLLDLERAVGEDEIGIRENLNKKLNNVAGGIKLTDKHKSLRIAEAKDQKHPLFQTLKHYKVDEEEETKIWPKINYAPKPTTKTIPNTNIWAPRPTIQQRDRKKLFGKAGVGYVKPTTFNLTKEIENNFQGHQFLGPIKFNQNIEDIKTEKPYSRSTSPRYTVPSELEKREFLDQQKVRNQKVHKIILSSSTKQPSFSFDHQEESNEMYNQILANIQSVFGLRTEPLKSTAGRNSIGGPHQELSFEENKALTWAVPLRKRVKKSEEKLVGGGDKVKTGSEGENKYKSSVFPSDIVSR